MRHDAAAMPAPASFSLPPRTKQHHGAAAVCVLVHCCCKPASRRWRSTQASLRAPALHTPHRTHPITHPCVLASHLHRGQGKDHSRQLPALVRYGRDLSEEARRGLLDPVIGRQDVIQRTLQVRGVCALRRHTIISPAVRHGGVWQQLMQLLLLPLHMHRCCCGGPSTTPC